MIGLGISVYRDGVEGRVLLGRIEGPGFSSGPSSVPHVKTAFTYSPDYLDRAIAAGELGVSERLPLSDHAYSADEFGPFFQGLLPEGEIRGILARRYQIPRNDYLSLLEQLRNWRRVR